MWKQCLTEKAEIGRGEGTKKNQIESEKETEELVRERATEDSCVTAQRMMRGERGDQVVIKKCAILTSELSAVRWGIHLWRAGKERRREGWSERGGSLLTVRSIDFSLLLYLIAQSLAQGDLGFLPFCVCVCVYILQINACIYSERR